MNGTLIFRSVCGPLSLAVKDKVCTEKAAQKILALLIQELADQGWVRWQEETFQNYAKFGWVVEAFRENGIYPPYSPALVIPPFKDMLFAVNMLTGEVDVTVNGGDLAIMKLTATEFQDLMESGLATLELVAPKPQALATVGACGGGCSS